MRGLFTVLILAAALLSEAFADASVPLADVLNLDAQATSEVPYDIAIVTLAIDRESKSSDTLSAEINKILADAMAEAKKAGLPLGIMLVGIVSTGIATLRSAGVDDEGIAQAVSVGKRASDAVTHAQASITPGVGEAVA